MPWSFRRSVSRGPLRLNFSKRGVGASVGFRGLRLGIGPRGTYVRGGRGGFYYQQYQHSGGSPVPRSVPAATSPAVVGTATEFVAEPTGSGDDPVAAINRNRNAFRWSALWFAAAILGIIFLAMAHAGAGWYIILLPAFVYGAVLRRHESLDRAIVLHYELDGDLAARYASLTAAFRDAARSTRI